MGAEASARRGHLALTELEKCKVTAEVQLRRALDASAKSLAVVDVIYSDPYSPKDDRKRALQKADACKTTTDACQANYDKTELIVTQVKAAMVTSAQMKKLQDATGAMKAFAYTVGSNDEIVRAVAAYERQVTDLEERGFAMADVFAVNDEAAKARDRLDERKMLSRLVGDEAARYLLSTSAEREQQLRVHD